MTKPADLSVAEEAGAIAEACGAERITGQINEARMQIKAAPDVSA